MQSLNRRALAAYTLIFALVLLMAGCGSYGGGSSADKKAATTVTQIQMFPAPSISLAPGEVTQMSAAALNVNGSQVFTETITFNSSNPAIQITPGGLLCAGRWDNLANPVICRAPGSTGNPDPAVTVAGITSNITASAGGVTSPVTVASVHLAITSIAVSPTAPACVGEAGTQVFTAKAFNGANDITTSVGTFNWTSGNSNVATIPATGDTGQTSQATATAVHPGVTNITASIGTITPITATPVVFTQCLVASIKVTVPPASPVVANDSDSHFEIGTSATRTLNVEVRDSTNTVLNTLPSLTWNSTRPLVATVSGTTTGATVNSASPGTVGISASCLPNNCNIGTSAHVTSNLVTGTITGTASTSATAYVTCTEATTPCTTIPSGGGTQTQLFPINGTTLGTAINLPHTPTSMLINPQNSKIYLGSTAGLMLVDAGANAFSSTVVNAPGDVLTVAPNGNGVVVSNTTDVFLYNGSTVTTLLIGTKHVLGATAAAFSPDSGTLLVTTSTGELWFEIPGTTPSIAGALSSPKAISFLPSGTFAIAATSGGLVPIEICDKNLGTAVPTGSFDHVIGVPTTLPGPPTVAVDSVVATLSPAIHRVDYGIVGSGTPPGCPFTLTPTDNSVTTSGFTANQLVLSPDSLHAFVIGPTVVDYDIANNSATSVVLTGADAKTGGVAANGTLYVAGGADLKVHVITAGAEGTPITTTIPADLVVTKSH
jgi:hypothetical protein